MQEIDENVINRSQCGAFTGRSKYCLDGFQDWHLSQPQTVTNYTWHGSDASSFDYLKLNAVLLKAFQFATINNVRSLPRN